VAITCSPGNDRLREWIRYDFKLRYNMRGVLLRH
jgi:hypothetical protein